jgi:hypothetical protein
MPATRAPFVLALGLALAACGRSPVPPPAPVAPGVIATPRLTADDAPVARVNGRTVWASCVAVQAGRVPAGSEPERRAAALDQCIAFELLAQAAEARGLAGAPEIAEARRAAAVNRLVETAFEQRYRTPADLGPLVDRAMKLNGWRMHLIQLRASTFARFVVPEHAAPAIEARAHALANRLAAELAGQTGLYSVHLIEAAHRIAKDANDANDATGAGGAGGSDVKLETSDFRPAHRDDLVKPYGDALYAIPEVGRTSPAFRTPWGWDVVMWTGGVEPRERTRDELVAEMFPELRRQQFQLWVNQIARSLGVHVEIDEAAVKQLDTGGGP